MSGATRFYGTIQAVRARLLLIKFEGETTAKGAGHLIVIEGTRTTPDNERTDSVFTVAFGPAALKERAFRRGDLLRGEAHPVPLENHDTPADLYRVGVLRTIAPGTEPPPHLDYPRFALPLTIENAETCSRRPLPVENLSPSGVCFACPYGTVVSVVRVSDPRNLKTGQWKRVPACLGPEDCPHYVGSRS